MNESKPIKGENQKPKTMNESNKKEIYSQIYDSAGYLVMNHNLLPKCIGEIDLRLNKKEIKKLKNILWYIAHSKLWSES